MDVTYSPVDGMLHLAENNKNKDPIKYYKNTKHFVLEFLPGAERPQTSDPRFAFTGAAPGDPVWIVPISPRDPNLLQLGVSAERIDDGVLGAYNETDPRINNVVPIPWIRLNLVDVQGPGYFSVWQIGQFGNPTVWIATAGNPNPDLFFTLPGGHVDYNWCFTQPGDYYVDFQATAILPDGTPVASAVTTYHFQVDPAPDIASKNGTLVTTQQVAIGLPSAPLVAPSLETAATLPVQAGVAAVPTAAAADEVFATVSITDGSARTPHTVPPITTTDDLMATAAASDLLQPI
jgi:surface-anchored protein